MGLHHQANHGRPLHGLEARQHLEHAKRDSHGSKIKMNVPDNYRVKAAARPADAAQTLDLSNKEVANDDDGVATVVSVVYQTVSADFTGATAGYVTVTPTADSGSDATSTANDSAKTADKTADSAITSAASSTVVSTSVATVSPTSSSSVEDDGSNNKSNFLNPPKTATSAASSSATNQPTALVGAGVTATRGATAGVGTPLTATHTSGAIAKSSEGMTGGAKAGLAIGIIGALALCAGLLFFCYRRKRNPKAQHEITDEKRGSTGSSLFGGKAMSEKHASVAAASVHSTRTASTAPRLSLRPVTQFLPVIGENRKSNASTLDAASAAMSEKPKSMWERRSNPSDNPFADNADMSEKQAPNPFNESESKPTAPFGHTYQPSWEGTEPPTPRSTKFGTASAVAVAAAGTANAIPPTKGANNVHRVQLDFKPSMDDELELKSGQLVRILHEYDDGWALCIRMDRSQQGVTPRTCLSKLPVKPRPQSPPQVPNGRPMTPTGPPGMMPRPLTPQGRERADSSSAGSDGTPTAVPARKPVPGQAL